MGQVNKSVKQARLALSSILSLAVFALGSANASAAKLEVVDPRDAHSNATWLDNAAMTNILRSGTYWCMEPEDDSTCAFASIVTGGSGVTHNYTVMEMWEPDLILHAPSEGLLKEDGFLCETVDANFDDISVLGLNGKSLKPEDVAAIAGELEDIWASDIGKEYCYLYGVLDASQSDIISQFLFFDGQYLGDEIAFSVDANGNADGAFSLRP